MMSVAGPFNYPNVAHGITTMPDSSGAGYELSNIANVKIAFQVHAF